MKDLSPRTREKTLQIAAGIRTAPRWTPRGGGRHTISGGRPPDAPCAALGQVGSPAWAGITRCVCPGVDERELRLSACGLTEQEKEPRPSLDANPPHAAEELVARARRLGAGTCSCSSLRGEADQIAREGRFRSMSRWAKADCRGRNSRGHSPEPCGTGFVTADQSHSNDRVRGLVSR